MTISYHWLHDYLPEKIAPERLSAILTSIGLEVESMEKYESVRGGLEGLVVGEVMSCVKHPDADKLKLTTVDIGNSVVLSIVCGAPNVAVGQKVIVAPIGTTIHPYNGNPLTMKKAKIRGVESEGMICAEDEIGLSEDHDGIMILSSEAIPGTPVADLFNVYSDYIYEIGLTPNRMDAMSHWGVARDVCAYLSYHEGKKCRAEIPFTQIETAHQPCPIEVNIQDTQACRRYTGICITGVEVKDSPDWLQKRLRSIGLKPINNMVDITNFILHETGQPLHTFDMDKIKGNQVLIKHCPADTLFTTLDDQQRKLSTEDLMICHAEAPMCLAGVYGGKESGVGVQTKNIFLESACFDKISIRRTSLRHQLRTDAATRFEKGVDISQTFTVLMRAAVMMAEIGNGKIEGAPVDIFPNPTPKVSIRFESEYLTRLSGKSYPTKDVKTILEALGFEVTGQQGENLELLVPYHKNDISIQADIVEEIMRIDGLDQIQIPDQISIAPSHDRAGGKRIQKEKIAQTLVGWGFHEIFTNSITHAAHYDDETLRSSVKMMNSLSQELNLMRPDMLQSGLQVIHHNLNRKNNDLQLFEFGKSYKINDEGLFTEQQHLALYLTGQQGTTHWKSKPSPFDFYSIKGLCESILELLGFHSYRYEPISDSRFAQALVLLVQNKEVGILGEVSHAMLKKAEIKSTVFFADFRRDLMEELKTKPVQFTEISKFPAVHRDLAIIVDKNVSYSRIEQIALSCKITALRKIGLFDVFESEKLGHQKKSMAISFLFADDQKTMTDQEIDRHMQDLIQSFEKQLQAEIRK